MNQEIGREEVLSPRAVFIIKCLGCGRRRDFAGTGTTVGVGFGLIAAYLIVVNGVIHVSTR